MIEVQMNFSINLPHTMLIQWHEKEHNVSWTNNTKMILTLCVTEHIH